MLKAGYISAKHNVQKGFDMYLTYLFCSFLYSDMIASLPTNGQGFSVFKGAVPGAPGVLSSNEQFYTWLNDNLIGVIYKDAQCGNGICEFPEEVKGVGEYGWYQPPVLCYDCFT